MSEDVLPIPSAFDLQRQDERDDRLFYIHPRLVVHIDEQAIAAVSRLFEEMIPRDSVILDLMSSWRSHLPVDYPKASLVGLGLNAVEMRENPDLDEVFVHDVNRDPQLPFEDAFFDAVVLTVSLQYLVRPVDVFREVNRVLKPRGPFLVTFSNRMFFTKAVRIWTVASDEHRMRLVESYLHHAGNYVDIQGMERNADRGPYDDPLYAVTARRASPPVAK